MKLLVILGESRGLCLVGGDEVVLSNLIDD